jgi:hypothetical protein
MFLNKKKLIKSQLRQNRLSPLKILTVSIFAILLLSSCSSSGTTASSNTTLTRSQEIAIIKTRWIAAFNTVNADAIASTSGVADTSGLSDYFTGNQYSLVVNNMKNIAAANVISRGSVQMGNHPQVTLQSNHIAIVTSCGIDSGWFENRKTKQPELGTSPGALKSNSTTTLKDISGLWKIVLVKIIEGKSVC